MTEINQYEVLAQHAKTDRQLEYLGAYFDHGGNITKAAEALGIDRRAVGRALKGIKERAAEAGMLVDTAIQPRVLFLDIETSPINQVGWTIWKDSTPGGYRGVLEDSKIICFSYKFKGDKDTEVASLRLFSSEELSGMLHHILDQADWVVMHNGDKFDIKRVNTDLLMKGYAPYSPIKTIDTLKMLRQRFKFTSNRLDDICQILFGIGKIDTGGISLWLDCMKGDKAAYAAMEEYNVRDVELLEILYNHIRGWYTAHPNFNLFTYGEDGLRCTTCGSDNLKMSTDKTVKTSVSQFPLLQCGDCGAWSRGRHNITGKDKMEKVLTHAK